MDGKISSVRCLPVAKFSKRSWLVALDQDISIYESLCGLIGFSQVLSHGFQSYHQVTVVELLEPDLEGFCGTVAAVSLEEITLMLLDQLLCVSEASQIFFIRC